MSTIVTGRSLLNAVKQKLIAEVISAQRTTPDFALPDRANLAEVTEDEARGLSSYLRTNYKLAFIEAYPHQIGGGENGIVTSRALVDRAYEEAVNAIQELTGRVRLKGYGIRIEDLEKIEDPALRSFAKHAYLDAAAKRSGNEKSSPTFRSVRQLMMDEVAEYQKTICGIDERIPSNIKPVGRLVSTLGNGGCTVTMVSPTIAVTAGHCSSVFKYAEFNTKPSAGGGTTPSEPEDIYEIEEVIITVDGGQGNDYAVLKLKPNSITGKKPGEAQGTVPVKWDAIGSDEALRIVGYGVDRAEPERHLAQQKGEGKATGIDGSRLSHQVDTMGGNSGSFIVLADTGEGVAIHTHGGCRAGAEGSNRATLLHAHNTFRQALEDALRAEAEEGSGA